MRTNGFTLIETIIAIGIISVGLIVAVALAVSNITLAQDNANRIVAGQLAQEGIEVIRNIRDSNWMRRANNIDRDNDPANGILTYDWDSIFPGWPLYSTCTLDGCPYLDIRLDVSALQSGATYPYTLEQPPSPYDLIPCMASPSDLSCRIWLDQNGYYVQAANKPTNAKETPFFRRVTLKPLCTTDGTTITEEFNASTDIDAVCDVPGASRVGFLVESKVIWKRANRLLDVSVKERLYDWQ